MHCVPLVALILLILSASAFAADNAAEGPNIAAIIGEVLGTILTAAATAFLAWLQAHIRDETAKKVVSTALRNALGAMQQASGAPRMLDHSAMTTPGLSPAMREGLHYVLTHAGAEAERLGITPDALVEKLRARVGLLNIETNIATAASPDPSPKPLDPVLPPVAAYEKGPPQK